MSALTAKRVIEIAGDCLFQESEDSSKSVIAQCILNDFGFHKERLEGHKAEILELLQCLPAKFQHHINWTGSSFLDACVDKDGAHWGEHPTVELLVALGIAAGYVTLRPTDRALWINKPGGMPYFSVEPNIQ